MRICIGKLKPGTRITIGKLKRGTLKSISELKPGTRMHNVLCVLSFQFRVPYLGDDFLGTLK